MVMWKEVWGTYGRGFLMALGLHMLLGFCLLCNFSFGHARQSGRGALSSSSSSSPVSLEASGASSSLGIPQGMPSQPEIVQAVAVDEKAVAAEVERLDLQEKQKKQEEINARHQLEALKHAVLKTKKEQEQQAKALKAEKEKQKKELETLKAQKEKRLKELSELDERRQEEQERAKQARLDREKEEKRKMMVGARAQVGGGLGQSTTGISGKSGGAGAAAVFARQQEQFLRSMADEYAERIKVKLENVWERPSMLPDGLQCRLQIQLTPEGEVLSARVVGSSGNIAFDRSAESAAFRASPLPLPKEPELIKEFTDAIYVFAPDIKQRGEL